MTLSSIQAQLNQARAELKTAIAAGLPEMDTMESNGLNFYRHQVTRFELILAEEKRRAMHPMSVAISAPQYDFDDLMYQ
jgi:hypothetical protein